MVGSAILLAPAMPLSTRISAEINRAESNRAETCSGTEFTRERVLAASLDLGVLAPRVSVYRPSHERTQPCLWRNNSVPDAVATLC